MDAVGQAVNNPLLEISAGGATDIIMSVTGDITLFDANDASEYVLGLTGRNVNLIFGEKCDQSEPDVCKVTVIATGISADRKEKARGEQYAMPRL